MNLGPKYRCILHIGFHKTGSTSIQHFLWRHRARLRETGIALYEGRHIQENHVELHVAAMRVKRMSPFKQSRRVSGGPEYRQKVEARLASFFAQSGGMPCLFTSEGLSLLKEPGELAWLRSVMPGEVKVIAYLRHLDDYKSSYTYMCKSQKGSSESQDPESFDYLKPDSWLWNYAERLRAFQDTFGAANVAVLDYDAATQADGSVIPSFLAQLGIIAHFTPEDWKGIYLNRRPSR